MEQLWVVRIHLGDNFDTVLFSVLSVANLKKNDEEAIFYGFIKPIQIHQEQR